MSVLIDIEGYETKGIKIDPNGTEGDVIELHGLLIVLPKKPKRSEILFHDQPKELQMWQRIPMPEELQRIRSMDEWFEKPAEFRSRFRVTSRKSFSVGGTVCGFTIMGSLRILQGDTICFYNGLKLISDTHHTLLSKEKSFSTWLLAKLIPVVSVSFILSVVVLATPIYALLYLLTKLVKLKRSCWAFSQRLVKTLRKTSS